ncbi:MAG: site-specific DNA-methyltransferase [Novosphingobium sp.]|uniref:site-specific DNA-methyltransferase n=1 Tax=Novosphingobium sp. TaxID=1874826 RepID=UPI0022C732D4|nr:site-specific DNA-methyltransferase [Novosphingobium sp.]MCZ8036455.1 site-specific DNA-methyltransferase [Novosphingobium sp.]
MQKIDLNAPESKSADIVANNVEALLALFPEAFTEGKIDFEVLKLLLGGTVDESSEKYGLNWHGKRRARQITLTPSTGTLLPCPDESVDWDTTQNLMIEGDNLEVLKLLQKSYSGKVKLIYIDPPYNTGNDFVYPDDFRENIKNYLELTAQTEDGRKISSNTEASGRFHTDWLNMMYPRLKLARNLLRDDGMIIVSVDDVEIQNVRRILDEVFGEENFIATLIFDRNRKNDAKYFSVGHEYMCVYAKSEQKLSDQKIVFRGEKEGVEELKAEFERLKKLHDSDWEKVRDGILEIYASFEEDDPRQPLTRFRKLDARGPYRDDGNINWPGGNGPRYEVLHPNTKRPCKLPISGWRYPTPERFWEEVEKGRIVFGPDETTVPRVRTNLFENSDQVMISVNYSYAQTAANQFNEIFDGQRVFDNPKPVIDIARLVSYLCEPDDLVLDFFAGSGTTGHAVLAENANRGARRRFILVQLPEPLDAERADQKIAAEFCAAIGKPANIAEITKERLRRSATRVRRDHPLFAGDMGFRVFKLHVSNIRAWEPNAADLENSLLKNVEHLVQGRKERDVLYELLLKLGLDLCVPMEAKTIAGKSVHSIGGGALIVCLADGVTRDVVEALATGIVDWHKASAPAVDTRVVFKDSGFADDVAKSNMAAILNQNGLSNVRSL